MTVNWERYYAERPQDMLYPGEAEAGDEIVSVSDLDADVDALYTVGFNRGLSPGWRSVAELYRIRKREITLITGFPNHGKALALDTPIPTPTGWTTMGEIQIGDEVFDEYGKPCSVTNATEAMSGRPCYRLTFSDKTEIIADAEHQWLTRDRKAAHSLYHAVINNRLSGRSLKPRGTDQSHLRTYPSVKTTEQIASTLHVENGSRVNHSVPIAAPIELPERLLPIDPYVLGAWLGDGTSRSCEITTADKEIIDEIRGAGLSISPRKGNGSQAGTYAVGVAGYRMSRTQESLQAKLRTLGVLSNKHIPAVYRRSSDSQRMALLQGLMDTDGHITDYGRCEFTSVNALLAEQVYELIASLGFVPRLITGRATLNGKDCGEKYRITFTPGRQVFRLKRKACKIRTARIRLRYRSIIACEPVPSVPVRCIEVNSQSHLYLASKAFIPTHNSVLLDNMVVNMARNHGWKWGVFSAENVPLERHIGSLAELVTGKPFSEGPTPRMTKAELGAAKTFLDHHVHFIRPSEHRQSVARILELAGTMLERWQIDAVVLDPWNELDHSRPSNMREDEFISVALSMIRWFTRNHDIHFFIVAHPSKLARENGKFPVPTLHDIKGASEWDAKADNGICVWRDRSDPQARTQIYVQKIRFREVGTIGQCELAYDRVSGRFIDPRPSIDDYVRQREPGDDDQ